MMSKRRLRPRTLMGGALAVLLVGACYSGPEDENIDTGEAEGEFTVNESGFNNNPPAGADPIRGVDDGVGNLASTVDTDWWYALARGGDEVYVFVDPDTDDSFLELYRDGNLTTPLATDDASGPGSGSAIAAESVPFGTDFVFYNVLEDGQDATIPNYELFHYVGDPGDDQLESAGANGTVATAETVSAPILEGTLSAASDVDYWAFDARAGDTIVLIVSDDPDTDGVVDTEISIRDGNDAVLTDGDGDDQSANPYNAAGVSIAPSDGTYYARIGDGGLGTTTEYRFVVLVDGRPPVSLGPMSESSGGSTTSAIALKSQHSAEGAIQSNPDLDYYRVLGRSGDRFYALVDAQQSTPSDDPQIYLRSDTDSVIEIDDAGGPGSSSVIAGAILTSPISYLQLEEDNLDSSISDMHIYAATVDATDVANEITPESNATIATADDFTATRMRGTLTSGADTDHWRIPARAGDNIVVIVDDDPDDAGGNTVDTTLEIIDGNGNVLATGDNGTNGGNAAGPIEVFTDGVYYARITNGNNISDQYEIVALVTNGPVTCGDSDLDGVEGCDDGNLTAMDGCDATCTVEPGFNCSGQPSTCTGICGDGQLVATEGCDDANTTAGDGCSATCTVETGYNCSGTPSTCAPICGDGQIVGSEGCDDGNAVGGDGCSAMCAVENGYMCSGAPSACTTTCGDGITAGAEGCDDGNTTAADGCSATCAVENGYMCSGDPSVCTTTCGDGVIVGAETCDDGNTTAADGCGANCAVENGWMCNGEPSVCMTTCGDGVIAGNEACDDGNTMATDGCGTNCALESGWTCNGEPSVCMTTCGDGIVAGMEECDDGNTTDGDGCSSTCTTESTGQGGGGQGGSPGVGGGGPAGVGGGGPGATTGSSSGGAGGDETVADDGGCSCRVVGAPSNDDGDEKAPLLLGLAGLALLRRRR